MITRPTGSYAACHLVLHDAQGREIHHLRGGFRNGRLRVSGPLNVDQLVGELPLEDGKIRGGFEYEGAVRVDGTVDPDGRVRGSWSRKDAGGTTKGTLHGWVQPAEVLAVSNAVDPEASWPSWAGPFHNKVAAPNGPRLVEHLGRARVVWRSELGINRGQGNLIPYGRLGGYVAKALSGPTGGGGASPVVYGGKIYVFTYRPTHDGPHLQSAMDAMANLAIPKSITLDTRIGSDLDTDLELEPVDPAKKTARLLAGALASISPWAKEKYALLADEVVACLDAATGATQWVTVFPRAGRNAQDHKVGPVNCTPAVEGDTVYATGTTGRIYALDRFTGAVRWTTRMRSAGDVVQYRGTLGYNGNFNQSPVVAGEVLIMGDHRTTLYAFDRATGAERWRAENATSPVATPVPWTDGDRPFVLTLSRLSGDLAPGPGETEEDHGREAARAGARSRLQALDLRTGKPVWVLDGPFAHHFTVAGDQVLLSVHHPSSNPNRPHAELRCYRLGAGEPKPVWTTRCEAPHAPNPSWQPVVGNGYVYLSEGGCNLLLDLANGRVVKVLNSPGSVNQGVGILVGETLVTRIEGSHGNGPFTFHRGLGDAFHVVPVQPDEAGAPAREACLWSPPLPLTSAYHGKPMTFPIVDGRMYQRGTDGVYCIDLRAQ